MQPEFTKPSYFCKKAWLSIRYFRNSEGAKPLPNKYLMLARLRRASIKS